MSEEYVKLVVVLYKKKGMSFQDFKNYYENVHSKLIRFSPEVQHYVRRYFRPLDGLPYDTVTEDDDDRISVITELWFKDREALQRSVVATGQGEAARIIGEDEENLFDKSRIMVGVVEECVTDLAKIRS